MYVQLFKAMILEVTYSVNTGKEERGKELVLKRFNIPRAGIQQKEIPRHLMGA